MNALAPDLVAVTGDLVDGKVELLADEVAPFAGLRGRDGVYFVTGNHDHYSGADDWARAIAGLGLRVLRNERVAIGEGERAFDLVGVDDHRGDLIGARGRRGSRAARSRRAIPRGRPSCSRTTPRPSGARRRSASTCSSRGTRTADRSGRSVCSSGS